MFVTVGNVLHMLYCVAEIFGAVDVCIDLQCIAELMYYHISRSLQIIGLSQPILILSTQVKVLCFVNQATYLPTVTICGFRRMVKAIYTSQRYGFVTTEVYW